MRIAQVAPLGESVPPRRYGGTERVVSYLTEALVQMGHEVTLYASGDSRTRARLRAGCLRSLREHTANPNIPLIYGEMMSQVEAARHAYDIIHFHLGWFEFPIFAASDNVCLTTLHGRLTVPAMLRRLARYRDFPLVSISLAQRTPAPHQNWIDNIYHGMPDPGGPTRAPEGYLAFVGRISPEKRPDFAIEIASRAGKRIKLAAKVDPVDQAYFATKIRPLLARPNVEFLGELDDCEKHDLLSGADAMLFPIDWPEPFGLVMIEAMACGTPVIAFRRGSVPEVLEDGVTGFIVDDVAQAVAALDRLHQLDRARIRATFLRRFSLARMVRDYVALYDRLLAVKREGMRPALQAVSEL
jgi:glycosyltransferase involved in cell wall biosynthesis